MQESFHAIGTTCLLTVVHSDTEFTKTSIKNLASIIMQFEKLCSRFLLTSELSQINFSAGTKTAISTEMYAVLKAAQQAYVKTKGLYNPLILPALQAAGYIGSWPHPANFDERLDFSNHTVPSKIFTLTPTTVTLPKHAALDLGGIGKGYVLDQLAEAAQKMGIDNYWFSLGGDIICKGADPKDMPWEISVEAAADQKAMAATYKTDGSITALATSSIVKRSGTLKKDKWHHIVDPRTLKPAITDVLSATVVTGSGVDADVYAKCLVILGSKKAQEFIHEHKVNAVLLQQESKVEQTGTSWVA